jgi:hypothetical protein
VISSPTMAQAPISTPGCNSPTKYPVVAATMTATHARRALTKLLLWPVGHRYTCTLVATMLRAPRMLTPDCLGEGLMAEAYWRGPLGPLSCSNAASTICRNARRLNLAAPGVVSMAAAML